MLLNLFERYTGRLLEKTLFPKSHEEHAEELIAMESAKPHQNNKDSFSKKSKRTDNHKLKGASQSGNTLLEEGYKGTDDGITIEGQDDPNQELERLADIQEKRTPREEPSTTAKIVEGYLPRFKGTSRNDKHDKRNPRADKKKRHSVLLSPAESNDLNPVAPSKFDKNELTPEKGVWTEEFKSSNIALARVNSQRQR